MASSADDLILKMQHLEAQARATVEANAQRAGLERLKSAAQKQAWKSQAEVAALEKLELESDARLEELRQGAREKLPLAQIGAQNDASRMRAERTGRGQGSGGAPAPEAT